MSDGDGKTWGGYRERASRVPGAVVWERVVGSAATVHRVLPDGCVDVILHDGRLIAAGPDTRAHITYSAPGSRYVGLRLPPGVGPAVLGIPADEVRDARPALADLWPARFARRATAAIAGAARPGLALEVLAGQRLDDATPDQVARMVALRLPSGATVRALAAEADLSERQLHRRCVAAFGYGPKRLARIQRLQLALSRAREGVTTGAVLAAEVGYADQAHLAREVRSLTGVSLSALLD